MGPILRPLIESLLPQPIAEEIVPHIFDYDELKCGLRFINIRSSFHVKIPHLFEEIVKASTGEPLNSLYFTVLRIGRMLIWDGKILGK